MKESRYSNPQLVTLVVLRMLIGWHLLHEGVLKWWMPGAGGLQWLDHESLALRVLSRLDLSSHWIELINGVNTGVLVLTGLGLILGLFGRAATFGAAGLLCAYGLAHAPLAWPEAGAMANPYLLEAAALALLWTAPTSHIVGLDRLYQQLRGSRSPLVATTAKVAR